MMPLFLIGHHKAGQKIGFNPRYGHNQLDHPVDLGCGRVAAGIGVIGHLQVHLVEGIHAEHGCAAADTVVADVSTLDHLFGIGHLGYIAGTAKIAFLK